MENATCSLRVLPTSQSSSIVPVLSRYEAIGLMLIGFGGLSLFLAVLRNTIRRIVFKDSNSLDSAFDAGGKVSFGLTAVTVVSQMLWPADFLQTATNISKQGLGGSLFYSIGIVTGIQMFPLLSITLKTKAPGAKTFLQVIYARFGKPAHIMYCCVALFTNLSILMPLTIAAKTAVNALVKDMSDEMIFIILAVLFGSYCMIGGLGTTFYISYFTTALTYITIMTFVFTVTVNNEGSPASVEKIYNALTCLEGPDGNFQKSFLTFRSRSALFFGVVLFLAQLTFNFCDQASWQSRIAAKPVQGAIGFIIAAFLWFGIPTTITLSTSMTYLSMSYQNGSHLISSDGIETGYISPFVMEKMMGPTGAYLLITMLTMALMSTGSGEVMAIASIIVYDIYKTYINPFRRNIHPGICILCGKLQDLESTVNSLEPDGHNKDTCVCETVEDCKMCEQDVKQNDKKTLYSCPTHSRYRAYEDQLLRQKNWCLLWITIGIVPFGLIVVNSGMNLTWACFTMQAGIAAFVPPLFLVLFWTKLTSKGLIIGSICGILADYSAILLAGSMAHEDGLHNFFASTSTDIALFSGLSTGLCVSTLTTVAVSLVTYEKSVRYNSEKVWEATLAIDNPLHPWRLRYKKELSIFPENIKITSFEMGIIFRRARIIAASGFAFSFIVFLITMPTTMLSLGVLSRKELESWLTVCKVWMVLCAMFALLVPPIEEVRQIYRQYRRNKESVIQ